MTADERQLTIGLPVYNGEAYLASAIESILGQTYRSFTLVIADNASSDRTLAIAESYAARDERVVVLPSDTNRGLAWNFNRVFEGCRTPFFKWAAADDLLAPTCVERCLEALTAVPDAVLAFPWTRVVDAEGWVIGDYVDPLATSPDDPPHRRFGRVVGRVVKGNLVFALIRSDGLRRTRLHGGYPSSDYVLLAELALVGAFVEVPEPLFLRRDHPEMSRRANLSPEAISRFFDPKGAPVRDEYARLFREHLAAVRHSALPPAERLRTYGTLIAIWGRRRVRVRLALGTRIRRLVSRLGRR